MPVHNPPDPELAAKLKDLLGPAGFLDRHQAAERQTSFWNSEPLQALALVRPKSTEEVSAILALCHKSGQPVRVIGGGTGPVAGAEPDCQTLALSLERMAVVERVDVVDSICVVQAGAVLQSVQEAAAAHGLLFPLDLGARGSCTIGGNIATNAGGINVLRYGSMRGLVLGIESVLADGSVLSSLNCLLKNNAGYDLKQLFIGSEGTLGVVTRAVLRLFPQPSSRQTALVGLASFGEVIAFLQHVRQKLGGTISAFEVMWASYFEQQLRHRGMSGPFDDRYSHYVVLESEGSNPGRDASDFEGALASALEDGLLKDAVIAKSDKERTELWSLREDLEAVLHGDQPYGYDVGVPVSAMAEYVGLVEARIGSRWPNAQCFTMGHIADGNIHFFIKPGQPGRTKEECDEEVYGPLPMLGGTISAEHGIGLEKRAWLQRTRSADELAVMRGLKQAFDPKGILNADTVFLL
jgi:FAD/FMN-containing dehydrogenase